MFEYNFEYNSLNSYIVQDNYCKVIKQVVKFDTALVTLNEGQGHRTGKMLIVDLLVGLSSQ